MQIDCEGKTRTVRLLLVANLTDNAILTVRVRSHTELFSVFSDRDAAGEMVRYLAIYSYWCNKYVATVLAFLHVAPSIIDSNLGLCGCVSPKPT